MKKTIQLFTFCTTLFWACSNSPDVAGTTIIDNTVGQKSSSSITTSSSSQPTSSSESPFTFSMSTNHGLKLGSCIADGLSKKGLAKLASAADFEETSEEQLKAYMLYNSKGEYQVLLLNVSDYCSVTASVLTTRFGDTLEIDYGYVIGKDGKEFMALAKCICVSDHWFDIDAEYKDVKYIRFKEKTYEVNGDPILVHTRDESDYPTLTDPRDGKTYKTVLIWEQLWMAENLNYEMEDGVQSWCLENKAENCNKFGRQYTFESASAACPPGWHLPSSPDWGYLIMFRHDENWDDFPVFPSDYPINSLKTLVPGVFASFWTSSIDTLNNHSHTSLDIEFNDSLKIKEIVRLCRDDVNDRLSVRCMKD